MSAVKLLRSTKARLTPPGHWTSGALARNALGAPVPRDCSTATSWDLLGALLLESPKGGLVTALRLISQVAPWGGRRSFQIGPVQGGLGRQGVLDLLDSAIGLAEREVRFDEETPLLDDPAAFI